MNLQFSIDLAAELRKITEKQHLNDVHYLVQLVRHALTHRPHTIHIQANADQLVLTQDGQTFHEDEWRLLVGVTNPQASDQARQNMLNALEHDHGVAILSLLHSPQNIQIQSGAALIKARQGDVRVQGVPAQGAGGYQIHIQRHGGKAAQELEELKFYAAAVQVPITFNGETLSDDWELPDALLVMELQTAKGMAKVGLPAEGELCQITYFKAGVRVGAKSFLPPDGAVYHAYWNALDPSFEADYTKTIREADTQLHQNRLALYEAIPQHTFSKTRTARIAKLLRGLSPLPDSLETYPFFHDNAHQTLSLAQLRHRQMADHGLIYLNRTNADAPAFLPVLNAQDRLYLKDRDFKLIPYRGGKIVASDRHEPVDFQVPAWERLRRALNGSSNVERFRTGARNAVVTDAALGLCYQINPNDPKTAAVIEKHHPTRLGVTRYRLIALTLK